LRHALAVIAVALAGCYNPDFSVGRFQCSTKNACPPDHYCASDGYCYKNGVQPDLVSSTVADLAGADLTGVDLVTTVDLAGVDLASGTVQGQVVWVSTGGATVTGAGGEKLATSIGGTSAVGNVSVASMGSLVFGNFGSASNQ
jgi:hypothetical protein